MKREVEPLRPPGLGLRIRRESVKFCRAEEQEGAKVGSGPRGSAVYLAELHRTVTEEFEKRLSSPYRRWWGGRLGMTCSEADSRRLGSVPAIEPATESVEFHCLPGSG